MEWMFEDEVGLEDVIFELFVCECAILLWCFEDAIVDSSFYGDGLFETVYF